MNRDVVARCFRTIAVFGVVTAIVFGVIGWLFLTDLDENLDRSLQIGEAASVSVIETIDIAERLMETLDTGLETVGATLGAVESSLDDTAGVASTTASLSASLPQSFDDIDVALASVESLSGVIDSTLSGLSSVPFGPDYDPEVPLPVVIGNLREAFDPIGDDLTLLTAELHAFADGSADIGAQVDTVRADLVETRVALADSAALLDDYRITASEAGRLATSSRADMARVFTLARLAVLLLALFIVVAQFVPWWLAGNLPHDRMTPSPEPDPEHHDRVDSDPLDHTDDRDHTDAADQP